ncbi:type II toxin-antitoxin system VapC family toxin [Microbacterium sp.]|uniref:type II toxin-antitoxin system VapC family toxin n=1 Tax=Microbacterium sp. TaxID=51671 RepID=UPI003C750FF1
MIAVIDASALVESLDRGFGELNDAELHVPAVADVEVFSALRRMAASGRLTASEARECIDDYLNLELVRHGATRLLPRMWDMRHDISGYDAAYVVLAESLGGALVTSDLRLARAAERYCDVLVP